MGAVRYFNQPSLTKPIQRVRVPPPYFDGVHDHLRHIIRWLDLTQSALFKLRLADKAQFPALTAFLATSTLDNVPSLFQQGLERNSRLALPLPIEL